MILYKENNPKKTWANRVSRYFSNDNTNAQQTNEQCSKSKSLRRLKNNITEGTNDRKWAQEDGNQEDFTSGGNINWKKLLKSFGQLGDNLVCKELTIKSGM